MKTILCPNYLKPALISNMIKETPLFDIRIIPMDTYVYPEGERINDVIYLLMAKNALSNCSLHIYKDMIQYPSFIDEVITFAKTLILYNMDFNKLPEDNEQEKECKIMLKAIESLPFKEYDKRKITIVEPANVQCIDTFSSSLFDEAIKKQFSSISLRTDVKTTSLKSALNPRQEIEAAAQEIVKNDNAKDCIIVLSDYDHQIAVTKQVLNRYNIPAFYTKESVNSPVVMKYHTLVEFMMDRSMDNFIQCLFHHCFTEDFNIEEIDYINNHYEDIDDLFKPIEFHLTTLRKDEADHNTAISKTIYEKLNKIKAEIKNCLSDKPLEMAYEMIIKDTDVMSVNQIADVLNAALPYVKDKEDIKCVNYCIASLAKMNSSYSNQAVIVTSLNKPVYPRKKAYILECTAKAYPGFSNADGLFDEDYIAKCHINSLNDRYDLYLRQLEWIHHCASDITYSYYTNDYAGKSFECAFEIEQMFNKKSPWDLISNDNNALKDESLSYGKALFIKNHVKVNDHFYDDVLKGSVSAFERYFMCPYSYYIQYGLNIRKPQKTELVANTIGTIQHAIMENLVNEYHKEYADQDIEQFKKIAKPFFDDLKQLYPKKTDQIRLIEERMTHNLMTSFVFLKDMEKDTRFVPALAEKKFYDFFPGISEKVLINGTADRIDINNNYFRVVDYKSSSKSLEEKKIITGIQLQLLTYLIMIADLDIEETKGKELVGSYYYSLKNENVDMIAKKVAYQVLTTYNTEPYVIDNSALGKKDDREESAFETFMNNHRLVGTTLNHQSIGLDDGNHIKTNKNEFISDNIIECEKLVYETLYERLVKGEIKIAPCEHACLYCDYKSVCLNKKPEIKIADMPPIYEGSLSGKGEK